MTVQVLTRCGAESRSGDREGAPGTNLTLPYALLNVDIKSLLGGGIHEQLRPNVIPVLDDIKAMAAGKCRGRPKGPRAYATQKLRASQVRPPFCVSCGVAGVTATICLLAHRPGTLCHSRIFSKAYGAVVTWMTYKSFGIIDRGPPPFLLMK